MRYAGLVPVFAVGVLVVVAAIALLITTDGIWALVLAVLALFVMLGVVSLAIYERVSDQSGEAT